MVRECRPPAREPAGLAGAPLDDRDVDARQRQLARQHQSGRAAAGDHHGMFGRRHTHICHSHLREVLDCGRALCSTTRGLPQAPLVAYKFGGGEEENDSSSDVKPAAERPTTAGMDRILRSRWGANLLLIAASAVVPAASVHFPHERGPRPDQRPGPPLIMGVGASIAAVASVALMARGLRSRDGRAVVAGGAFATMTLLLAIHGLATPGVLLGPNGVVALAGGTALPAGAAILSLAALPAVRRPENVPPSRALSAPSSRRSPSAGVVGAARPARGPVAAEGRRP
jgi:hypothetical protein